MPDHPDAVGPGEYTDLDLMQAEAVTGPIPDGEMPGIDPTLDQRRVTLELQPVVCGEAEERAPLGEHHAARRTSTDLLPELGPRHDPTEQLYDHTADAQRENLFDPSQDDIIGPQSDQS